MDAPGECKLGLDDDYEGNGNDEMNEGKGEAEEGGCNERKASKD